MTSCMRCGMKLAHNYLVTLFTTVEAKTKRLIVCLKCKEILYITKGSGKIVIEGEAVDFKEGDEILIEPGEKYYWDCQATMLAACTPAWYPEQHKEVD